MSDITITRSVELNVAQVEGDTEAGAEFVDRWTHPEMEVVDAGRIIVRDLVALEAQARAEGLTIDYDVVAAEKS